MALILSIAFLLKHSAQCAEVGFIFDGAYDFKTPPSLDFSIPSWWQACQLSKSRVCLHRWLMSDGSQICVRALFSGMSVIERETRYITPDLFQINTFCQHLSLPLYRSHTLYLIYLVYSLSSGIPSIFLCNPQISVCVCTAPGRQCLKALSSDFPVRCDNMMTVTLFSGMHSLFFVSLNTHNKQRVPPRDNGYTFHPSLSPCIAWLRTDRWFEFEPCRHTLISDTLWIYLSS